MIYVLGGIVVVALVLWTWVMVALLRVLAENERAAEAERQRLLEMRVVNTALQFVPEPVSPRGDTQADDFERVGSIYADDE